jgi:hypothetical protein
MKKLTLLVEDDLYDDLHRSVGRGNIGRFVAESVRPKLAQMAAANDANAQSAFGVLHKYARPFTKAQVEEAKRKYMAERYAQRLKDLESGR